MRYRIHYGSSPRHVPSANLRLYRGDLIERDGVFHVFLTRSQFRKVYRNLPRIEERWYLSVENGGSWNVLGKVKVWKVEEKEKIMARFARGLHRDHWSGAWYWDFDGRRVYPDRVRP